jgi:hypothetical protein
VTITSGELRRRESEALDASWGRACMDCLDSGRVDSNDPLHAGWRFCACAIGRSAAGQEAGNRKHDSVARPKHYTAHPSGIECIQVTEHMGFNIGNAVKYLWRAGLKGPAIEDLKKARWYIDREIQRLGKATR